MMFKCIVLLSTLQITREHHGRIGVEPHKNSGYIYSMGTIDYNSNTRRPTIESCEEAGLCKMGLDPPGVQIITEDSLVWNDMEVPHENDIQTPAPFGFQATNEYIITERSMDTTSQAPSVKNKENITSTKKEEPIYNDVPYMVSVEMSTPVSNGSWTSLCSGTIIGNDKVLTAAHCLDELDLLELIIDHQLVVAAGDCRNAEELFIEEGMTNASQWRHVIDVTVHESYDFPHHDIALVFVYTPFFFNSEVAYVNIARVTADDPGSCKVAAFRKYKGNLDESMYLVADVNPLTKSRCSRLFKKDMRSLICCKCFLMELYDGHAGGPLVCRQTLADTQAPAEELLEGIVSGKNKDKATILFTPVSEYADWIDRNVSCSTLNNILVSIVIIIPMLFVYVLFLLTFKLHNHYI